MLNKESFCYKIHKLKLADEEITIFISKYYYLLEIIHLNILYYYCILI